MASSSKIRYLRQKLLGWFDANGRSFPWREDGVSNYELLFSEILLQRTRAETVGKYYFTFFGRYPDWETLSEAGREDLEEILKPLGLYQHRARRIGKIVEEYKAKKGRLPSNPNQLRDSNLGTLYVSNAFELFYLKRRAALLDVNMARVFSRYFGREQPADVRKDKELLALSRQVLNVRRCRELNWAVLDFAALVCKARNPNCGECPLKRNCDYVDN